MKKIVMKFGGTSVATGENIRHVAELVVDNVKQECRVVVAVSALATVTNKLIEIADYAKKGDEKKIQEFTNELIKKHLIAIEKAIQNKQIQKETEQVIKKIIAELEKVLI